MKISDKSRKKVLYQNGFFNTFAQAVDSPDSNASLRQVWKAVLNREELVQNSARTRINVVSQTM